jgi:hypothetical protein
VGGLLIYWLFCLVVVVIIWAFHDNWLCDNWHHDNWLIDVVVKEIERKWIIIVIYHNSRHHNSWHHNSWHRDWHHDSWYSDWRDNNWYSDRRDNNWYSDRRDNWGSEETDYRVDHFQQMPARGLEGCFAVSRDWLGVQAHRHITTRQITVAHMIRTFAQSTLRDWACFDHSPQDRHGFAGVVACAIVPASAIASQVPPA